MFCRARLLLCALLSVFVYIAIHEGGHAVAAVATGRTVAEVRIFSLTPHISLQGKSTHAQDAFAAAAGSGLVLALWFGYMLLRQTRRATVLSEGASFFAGIELLAWFVSSAAHVVAPPQNDVTKFIVHSGVSPLALALIVAGISAIATWLYFSERAFPVVKTSHTRFSST